MKSLNSVILSYMYAINDVKGLVQDLQEVNYFMSHSESVISSRVCSCNVTSATNNNIYYNQYINNHP